MDHNHHLDSLSEVMNNLREKGYNTDFYFKKGKLQSSESGKFYSPDQVKISDTFRFEGDSNPDDSSILYAIIVPETGEMGLLADAYGVSSNEDLNEYMQKVEK
ncbi:MAG: phosphoribosylpyrophosphate synthetase [Bacteroidota bacterium]